jgi:hypothetical protein
VDRVGEAKPCVERFRARPRLGCENLLLMATSTPPRVLEPFSWHNWPPSEIKRRGERFRSLCDGWTKKHAGARFFVPI